MNEIGYGRSMRRGVVKRPEHDLKLFIRFAIAKGDAVYYDQIINAIDD